MYLAQVIWNMCYFERKSIDEVIKYFDNPLVNKQFIETIIENNNCLRTIPKEQAQRFFKQVTPSKPGTNVRKVWDKVESIGGPVAFVELLKTKKSYHIAREWGFTGQQLINYKRAFIDGRYCKARYKYKLYAEIRKREKINKAKRLPNKKKMKNLW